MGFSVSTGARAMHDCQAPLLPFWGSGRSMSYWQAIHDILECSACCAGAPGMQATHACMCVPTTLAQAVESLGSCSGCRH